MRKTLLLSALVAGVLGIVAVAYAANTYKVDSAKVTPTKAGTVKKPKAVRIQFGYSVGTTDGNRPATSTDQAISFKLFMGAPVSVYFAHVAQVK